MSGHSSSQKTEVLGDGVGLNPLLLCVERRTSGKNPIEKQLVNGFIDPIAFPTWEGFNNWEKLVTSTQLSALSRTQCAALGILRCESTY